MTRSIVTCYLLSKICLYVLRLNFALIGLFRLQAVCFFDPDQILKRFENSYTNLVATRFAGRNYYNMSVADSAGNPGGNSEVITTTTTTTTTISISIATATTSTAQGGGLTLHANCGEKTTAINPVNSRKSPSLACQDPCRRHRLQVPPPPTCSCSTEAS